MKYWLLKVWHPECPGTHVMVWRNRFQRLIYPKAFATLGEVTQMAGETKQFINGILLVLAIMLFVVALMTYLDTYLHFMDLT